MSKRYRSLETLQANVRRELPRAALLWNAAARAELQRLTTASLNPALNEADFFRLVEKVTAGLPDILQRMDHTALEMLLEDSMGAAMANGIEWRVRDANPALQGKDGLFLGGRKGRGRGKPCGRSYISPDKKCRIDELKSLRKKSRKARRRKLTRAEKIAKSEAKARKPNPTLEAAIDRYNKAVHVEVPTGRTVEYGERVAQHLRDHEFDDPSRSRFTDLAERCTRAPDEVWQIGLRVYYLRHKAHENSRSGMLVITQQTGEKTEDVVTFTKKPPSKLKSYRRGKLLYRRQ